MPKGNRLLNPGSFWSLPFWLCLSLLHQNVRAQAIVDPDQPYLLDKGQIDRAVRRTFTDSEMKVVERGRLSVACQFDSTGRIESSKPVQPQGFKISALNEQLLQLNLRKYIRFYVPKAFKTPQTAFMRKVVLHYNGQLFKRTPTNTIR